MAKVNISEAAKLAGITRQYLYKRYINPGLISVESDKDGNRQIDTAEIIRVFGKLSIDSVDGKELTGSLRDITLQNDSTISHLQAEIERLHEQLQAAQEREREAKDREREAKERERWLQNNIDKLTDTLKLLEHRPEQTETKRRGFFARLLGR